MSTIVSRLDVTQIFCDVDDLCSSWEKLWQQVPQLPSMSGERRSASRMHISEVMTIARVLSPSDTLRERTRFANAFHRSGYRTFKEFYTLQVLPGWRSAFPCISELHAICGIDAVVFNGFMLFFAHTYR